MTTIRIDIPPDHHPETLKGESHGTQAGKSALTHIYEAYGKINDAAKSVQDKGRLATRAQPFAEAAIRKADDSLVVLRGQQKHLKSEIDGLVKPSLPAQLAAEIRSYWASQKDTATKAMQLIKAGDINTTAAILTGPAYLSGLDDEMQATLFDIATDTFASVQKQALNETDAALAKVERALDHFSQTMAGNIREWRDKDHQHLETLQ